MCNNVKDYLIEQNILLNCLMKIKAQFKVPLWSVIRIEIGWSWWKGVYKYLLLISSWWCDNGGCIPLQEKPSSAGRHRVGRVVWGKSPLNWIFPEAGTLISMALQHLWFCMCIPTVVVAATEKLWFFHCIGKAEQAELSISVTQAHLSPFRMGAASLNSHLLPHMWSNDVKLKARRAEWGVMNSCLF